MKNSLRLALVFVVLVLAGLVGMLIAEGVRDILFLACATAPLIIGAWSWWRSRVQETR
jgi:hypothetical protein